MQVSYSSQVTLNGGMFDCLSKLCHILDKSVCQLVCGLTSVGHT